jgi:hypothetical protein
MATTHTQELNTSIVDNLQNKEDIKTINSNLCRLNSFIQTLQDQCVHIKGTLTQLMKNSLNTTTSKKPSYQDINDSSHYEGPHSTHLPRDFFLLGIEVKKFDGSDPTGWVTQMEHYFSLHRITNYLAKICYGILDLDPECWQWWHFRRKACQGCLAWRQFLADLYDCFDSNTHHLG